MKKKRGKKGQVTIFIIVAILIIAIGVLIYMFYPKLKATISPETTNPSSFIQECLEEKIEDVVGTLSLQGGSIETSEPNSYFYGGNYVKYLCYTNQYYQTCVVQEPLLVQHIESEILNEISDEVVFCFNFLRQSYENKGYQVELKTGATKVELLPKRIVTSFKHELVLTKGESEKYDSFNVILNNNLYELASITNSIINWEAEYGDADVSTYMNYYHDLKVEKLKQLDGTTIYILTDRNNDKKFQFASRSLAWPPGYGV